MSTDHAHLSDGENPPPHSWQGLMVGFGFVAVTGMATVLLVFLWAAGRPVNLVPITDAFVRMTTETLQSHDVPAAAIIMPAPVLYENPAAVWHAYEITVDLPLTVHAAAIVRDLRTLLEPRHVSFQEAPRGAGSHEVRMAHGGVEFAALHLRGGRLSPERKRDYRSAAERLARQVERIVHERLPEEGQLAIQPAEDREDATTHWKFTRFDAYVPDPLAMRDIQRAIEGAMLGRDVLIETEERDGGAERLVRVSYERFPVINLLLTPRPPRRLPEIQAPLLGPPPDGVSVYDPGAPGNAPLEPEARSLSTPPLEWTGPPRIALIIDDGGEEPEATAVILGLDRSLTLAILPDTTGGTELALRAAAMGFEVMLHMPMETTDASQNYPNSLMLGVAPEEWRRLLERAREQVPGAVGMNNHTGGAFTADPDAVQWLMEYLGSTPLYFVDSRTTPRTVAFQTAREMGIPAAQRDVFLDNEPNAEYIEGRFHELLALAKERGSAIGIAHFRPVTATALENLLPRLEEEGVRLVRVSELVQ